MVPEFEWGYTELSAKCYRKGKRLVLPGPRECNGHRETGVKPTVPGQVEALGPG